MAVLGWAPAIEEQAVDRVHRMGQTRPTKVWRLVIQDTVEEKVLITQDMKRQLVGTAFQEPHKTLMSETDVDRVSRATMIRELLAD